MGWRDIPYADEPEEIDQIGQPAADIAESMGDLARTNQLFGGTRLVLSHVARLLRDVPSGSSVRILDIATGSGDIPNALEAWGRRRGLRVGVVGVDSNAAMLTLAQQRVGAWRAMPLPTFHLAQADALALPFAPGSFDIALCSLAFHHFGFDASAQVLRAMDRLTTRGFVVSDLRRDKLSLWGVQTALKWTKSHAFTQHDGPASVRRAWTLREYRSMVSLSGVQRVVVRPHYYFRVSLVQDKRILGKH